jgi:hypothetical protein
VCNANANLTTIDVRRRARAAADREPVGNVGARGATRPGVAAALEPALPALRSLRLFDTDESRDFFSDVIEQAVRRASDHLGPTLRPGESADLIRKHDTVYRVAGVSNG